jgi:UPF0716 protein FxsA
MFLLILLFIAIPLAELYVIIQVGEAIGVIPTLAILLADAVLGSLLLRHQGRAAWRRFNQALEERRFPAKEVADGVMITFGGALLLTPGFITDIFGVILLLPPTRAVIRRILFRVLTRRFRIVAGPAGWGYDRVRGAQAQQGQPGPSRGGAYDVDGTAQEVGGDRPSKPRPRPDDRQLPPIPEQ